MSNNNDDRASRRDFLAAEVAGSVATIGGKNSSGETVRMVQAGPGELLPHYVYGNLVSAKSTSCVLDAPLDGKLIRETISYDEETEIFSLYGPDLSKVPVDSQIAMGTPVSLRNPDGSRHATWINVNPIYSHGDVLDVGQESLTVQQAHGGAVRKLTVTSTSRLRGPEPGQENIALSDLSPGHHVFFTGLATSAELTTAEINVVLLHKMG